MLERFVTQTDFSSYEDFVENFKIIVPDHFNYGFDVVDAWADEDPDRMALVWCDEDGNEASFTFGQMREYTNRTANFLSSLGIRKGDPVMLILKRRYEYWFCLVALHKIGATAIPATHLLTAHDVEYRNNAADIKMIISVHDQRIVENIEAALPASPTIEQLVIADGSRAGWHNLHEGIRAASPDFQRPVGDQANANSDSMLLYFTSGTAGMPKMVLHDFTYPLGHITTGCYWQNVRDGGLHCTVSDTGWAKAAWGKIYGQWIGGTAMFVFDIERFDPVALLEKCVQYKVSTLCAPPTVLRFMIREELSQFDLSTLKYCVTAGEPLNPEVYNTFLEKTGLQLREGFGQTETTVLLATYPWLEPRPGSMGKPSPNYDVDLLNMDGEPCEVGEEGQIVIHTDHGKPVGLFEGYYRDPELTASSWHDGVYYTGDMAWRDEDDYYWFVGRADDVIKSSGYRIGPFEVESALIEHDAVVECAITGVPDDIRGQVVKATVILSKGYTASDALAKELQEHVKHTTAPYKYPRIIEFVDELPKTISGKIRRNVIRGEQEADE